MQSLLHSENRTYQEYRNLILEFCTMAAAEGLPLTPWHGDEPVHFLKLSPEGQTGVVDRFRAYVEVCREVRMQGASLKEDQVFLWRMMQKLKLHPPADLLSEMRQGEIIEIHSREFIQIYRNLRFYEICGYTIDDILSRPFFELLTRDQSITGLLVDIGQTLFSGKVQGVLHLTIPEHSVMELDSEGRHLLVVQQRIAAPLRGTDGQVEAAVTFLRCLSCVPTASGEYGS